MKQGTSAQIHRLMVEASRHFANGQLLQAATLCRQVINTSPEFFAAQHLLGVCYLKSGDAHSASAFLQCAQELNPHDAQLNHHLGIALSEIGDTQGAEQAFARAAESKPNDPEILYNLAVTSADLGNTAAAQAGYRRTLALAPDHAQASAALASLCESENKLDEAQKWVSVALDSDHANTIANLTQAKLDFRAGRYDAVRQRLEGHIHWELTPRNRALVAGQLGLAYDRLKCHAAAFDAFRAAKQHLADIASPIPDDGVYSRSTLTRIARHFDDLTRLIGHSGEHRAERRGPVFLVGFPRSGTTLLDQILSSHSKVVVLEEKETLHAFLQRFATTEAGLAQLAHSDAEQLCAYRDAYWSEVGQFVRLDETQLFVDKLPLNTAFMPLILRLFPRARFIFALRDPRDVALSCFMQVFDMTEAMRHFFTLDGVADFYSAVMHIGLRSLERFPQHAHIMRYESLIADFEPQVRKLIAFLGLPWEAAVMQYDRTARTHRINTPSYHQVVQPIYKTAHGRWRNYATQLETIMPRLQPFVEYFGYA